MQLDFWFDLSCPYAYLAAQRLGAAIRGRDVTLRYRPMLLGGVFRATGAGDGPMATLSPAKRDHLARDLVRWADLAGVPLRTPAAHPMRTVLALRTLLGLPEACWPAAVHELFVTYWQRGEDLTTEPAITAALQRAGVDELAIRAALDTADSAERKAELRARTDEAVRLGIFGAPAFVVHGQGKPQLLWGQDRLAMVTAMLDGWQPPAPAPPPLAAAPSLPARQVDFYFDSASPYSYLALTQIERITAGHDLRLRPILLGGLFRAIGTPDVPLFAFPEAKRRYLMEELGTWAAWWAVPFRFPSKFPQRTTMVQRILLALATEPTAQLRAALGFARAMWVEQRDLEDEAVVRDLLRAMDLDEELATVSQRAERKAELVAATAAAAEAGVFGVPTCIVHDERGPRRFWGQDRLGLVTAALAGWRAAGE